MKKYISILLLLFLVSVNSFAFGTSVVIQMAQGSDDALKEATLLIEDGVLDILFDSGYIVTNLPACINKSYESLQEKMIQETKKIYMNTVVYIGVQYYDFGSSKDKIISVSDIESVQMKIIDVKTKNELYSGLITGEQKGQYETDIIAVKHFATSIGLEIKKQLEKTR